MVRPTLEELKQMCSNEVDLDKGEHYCSIGNCFRKAVIKMGFSHRCPIHRYHKKFCDCDECMQKGSPYLGSVFTKVKT